MLTSTPSLLFAQATPLRPIVARHCHNICLAVLPGLCGGEALAVSSEAEMDVINTLFGADVLEAAEEQESKPQVSIFSKHRAHKLCPQVVRLQMLVLLRQTHGAIEIAVKCKNVQSGIVSYVSTGLRKSVGNICARGRGFTLRGVCGRAHGSRTAKSDIQQKLLVVR